MPFGATNDASQRLAESLARDIAAQQYAQLQAMQAHNEARARAAGEMHKAKREAVTAEKQADGTYSIR